MATRAANPSRSVTSGTGSRAVAPAPGRIERAWNAVKAVVRRTMALLAAAGLVVLAVALVAILLSYSPLDPSLNSVTGRAATNNFGIVGSYVADLFLQILGWAALLLAPVIA